MIDDAALRMLRERPGVLGDHRVLTTLTFGCFEAVAASIWLAAMVGFAAYTTSRRAPDVPRVLREHPQILGDYSGYLQELGVNMVHVMPILECPKGASDGGYAVSNFRDIDERVGSLEDLRESLRTAEEFLRGRPQDATWKDVELELRHMGFEPGWGDTVARIRETMGLLSDILEAPSPERVEEFLARIPMISSIVILTPHGYFGQAGVLGLPDTGGQVVYILDQVRALEREMRHRLHEQGLAIEPQILVLTRLIPHADGTTCDQRIEDIVGTTHARILRVPFRNAGGEVIPHWISRFEIWPYLERYADEAQREMIAELGGRPDLIVGNYSDGNLVASLMSQKLGITQCNIAHALEKTKYLYSDLYWQDNEPHYHFSCQFTADLIAMNSADFIITSTYQEIAGTDDSLGQYESHAAFTMPGLYRVVHGIDVHDPKFNIVSPGVAAEIYFPAGDDARRLRGLHPEIGEMVLGGPLPDGRGRLEHPDRPIVLSMARLDRIKNLCYRFATQSGLTVSIDDVRTPKVKRQLLDGYEDQADKVEKQLLRYATLRKQFGEKEDGDERG